MMRARDIVQPAVCLMSIFAIYIGPSDIAWPVSLGACSFMIGMTVSEVLYALRR